MRTPQLLLLAISLVCLTGTSSAVTADEPQTDPATIWKYFGIPQGTQKVHDLVTNRRGNLPQLERKPPLKRLSDPANLTERNEPLQKAVEIKSKEELAAQKVKAIKYLATVGCGSYDGVAEALLSALDDCDEEVRYQAARALGKVAGDCCQPCGEGCCSAKVMTKLHQMAFEQDDAGCYTESSQRVRRAAQKALEACQQMIPVAKADPSEQVVPLPAVEETTTIMGSNGFVYGPYAARGFFIDKQPPGYPRKRPATFARISSDTSTR